jgi:serine/threonine-protein kinase RsbW
MNGTLEIRLANRLEELGRVADLLAEFVHVHEVPATVLPAADLALSELLTNVISYGHSDGAEHEIKVQLAKDDRGLAIEIEDDGIPFNPVDHPPVDTSLALEDKPIGGLGIHLVRKMMDTMEYERRDGKNILTLRKVFPK